MRRRRPAARGWRSWLEIGDPAVADGLGDELGQVGIGQQQPAPRRDAVGLVVEALRIHLGEILDGARAQQPRVDRGHAVGAVRADDGQIRHAHLPASPSLDKAHAFQADLIARKALPDLVEKTTIDFVDESPNGAERRVSKKATGHFSRASGSRV